MSRVSVVRIRGLPLEVVYNFRTDFPNWQPPGGSGDKNEIGPKLESMRSYCTAIWSQLLCCASFPDGVVSFSAVSHFPSLICVQVSNWTSNSNLFAAMLQIDLQISFSFQLLVESLNFARRFLMFRQQADIKQFVSAQSWLLSMPS